LHRACKLRVRLTSNIPVFPDFFMVFASAVGMRLTLSRGRRFRRGFDSVPDTSARIVVSIDLETGMAESNHQANKVARGDREQLMFARSLVRDGREQEALDELLKYLRKNSNSVAATLAVARIYARQGKHQDAATYYSRAMKLDPMDARPHLHAGVALLKAKDFDRAQAAFKAALSIDPRNANAIVGLARTLQSKGDAAQATRYLQEALRLDPQHTQARMLHARILAKANNSKGAEAELESMVKLHPGKRTASIALARLHMQHKDYSKAADVLDTATQHGAEDPQVWKALARVRARSNDYGGAEAALSKAIGLQPTSALNHFRLVDLLLTQDKPEDALRVLERVRRRKPVEAAVHRYYGEIYRRQGLYKEAADSFRAALLHSPGGEAKVNAIEKDAGKDGANNWQALTERYLPAMEDLLTNVKEERRTLRASRPTRSGARRGAGRARRPSK
jgi:predicted Zn-dependent protease